VSSLVDGLAALRAAVATSHAREDAQNFADGGEVADQEEGPSDEHGPLGWLGDAIDWLRTKSVQGRHAMSAALPTSLLAHLPAESVLLPDQGSTNFLRREHLPDLSIENAEPHYAQEDTSGDPNWFSETTPFKFHNPHDVEQTADAASQLTPLAGPLSRAVRGIPRALGEGLMELGGHGTMSAAVPALARSGDTRKSLGAMMDELRKIMPAMNFARLSKMADYAPGGLKYMSPHGLYELGTTPAEVAMVRPGSMLDWSKPMAADRSGGIAIDPMTMWNDELLRSAMVAAKMDEHGLNWAPMVTIGADGERLKTVGHQGRHRDYAFNMLGDSDYSPLLLGRHHPKYDVHPMLQSTERSMTSDSDSLMPPFEYHTWDPKARKSDRYEEDYFSDPGVLADWQREHGGKLTVTPQLGRNRPSYLSGNFGPYAFPRADVNYTGPIFARGGLATFDEVE